MNSHAMQNWKQQWPGFYERNRTIVLGYAMMFVFLVAMSIYRPGFGLGSFVTFRSLMGEAAIIAAVALGQTFVILSGGIDVSVVWVVGGSAVLVTMLGQGDESALVWVVPAVLGFGLVVGLVNGLLIVHLKVLPVIVTLATNTILGGVMQGLTVGGQVTGGQFGRVPKVILEVVNGRFLEIPGLIWIMLLLTVFAYIVLSRSVFGRYLYAMGTSAEISSYSGVNVSRQTVLLYMLSGTLASLAGILLAGKIGRTGLGMGDPYLFMSVAAVAIGGTSILGGSGHFIGTIAGAMFLATLQASMPVLRVPLPFQHIFNGLVIILAVFISTRRASEKARPTTSPPDATSASRNQRDAFG